MCGGAAGDVNVAIGYTYNLDNQLKTIDSYDGQLYSFIAEGGDMGIDGLGRLKYSSEFISIPGQPDPLSRRYAYDYDMLSQLTYARIDDIGDDPWICYYDYKKDGNIYRKTVNGDDTYYKYNTTPGGDDFDSDIMTDIGDDSLIWDANGRLASTPDISFEYNDEGKLRYASIDGNSISLKYDLKGNRVWKQSTVSGQTTTRKYIVDVAGRLPTILCEIDASDPNSSLKYSYIYTPGGQILAQQAYNAGAEPNEPNDLYFYIHDRLGSVRLVISDAGDVNNSYTYSPSGEMFASECAETVYNPFLFTGQWWDPEIQQYYLRARMYSPLLSRFTGRDPILSQFEEPLTLHKYLYCVNNPLNLIDPRGEWSLTVGASVAAEVTFKFLNRGGWMNKTSGAIAEGLGLIEYYNMLLPLLEYGLFENDFLGPAGTAGVGITFAHDESKSLSKGWEIGPTYWAAVGMAGTTGSSAAAMIDIAYSPDAQEIDDLVGPFLEYGGSLTTPPIFWGINCFSASYSYGYNPQNEKIRLFTGSFGWGTPGKYHGWGGEGHIFKGQFGRWDPWFKN
jgi:RHS repeat-associated protein